MTSYTYVARDAAGGVLYVGVTDDPESRFRAHQYGRWWSRKDRLDLQEWPDRATAESRELDLIEALRPSFNRTDGRWRDRDRALLALRRSGMTWVAAGARLGMSGNAVRLVRRRLQRTGQIQRVR
jgi:hypothetical protein